MRNVTPISQLIDLDTDDRMSDGVRSLIRNQDSTYNMRQAINGNYMSANQYGSGQFGGSQNSMLNDMGDVIQPIQMQPKQEIMMQHMITCPEVMDHIQNCPICSKLYNQDKTLYLIIIVLMGLVILILLKRILEK